ncbi:D-amino acid aminotransferase [Acidihalobacter prosperus]|uniref:Aminodeoxychorismate lyase n=1 Tax=Acidihalobacter prosperus TaxID=160660 RepID=A0A1A6C6E4_9GAMM|nr:D-amino acid aminotransferase [Acidihalobacter prosperus]OBS10134.1 D-alanine aminotransferase [Acidihalobacter prosperus]
MSRVYLNGRFLPLAEACVPVLDRGFLFGDGIYEVIPAYGGHLFRLTAHLDRLDASLAAVRIGNPHDRATWRALLQELVATAGPGDHSVYLQVTRGADVKRDHAFPAADVKPTVFAMTHPLRAPEPARLETGASARLMADTRWARCDIKAITLLPNVLLRQAALDAGDDEAILVRDGAVLEGSASSLFIVADGMLSTPPKGPALLPGVTRDLVLELAQRHGLPWAERAISETDLRRADEIWLTSSTREVMAVTRLDGQPVGDGRPGPVWRRMAEWYQDCKAALRAGGECP